MKTIIAGSRQINDLNAVKAAFLGFVVEHGQPTEIVSGGAPGVDALGEHIATHLKLPVRRFPADWNKHGRAAGPIRNRQMAEYADALIAVWDGKSRGTASMISEARARGLKVYVHVPTPKVS